jgi:hypothetical protein
MMMSKEKKWYSWLELFSPADWDILIVGSSDSVMESPEDFTVLEAQCDRVIRFNRAPIKGYEFNVGCREDIRWVNPQVLHGAHKNRVPDPEYLPSVDDIIVVSTGDIDDGLFYREWSMKSDRWKLPFNFWHIALEMHDIQIDKSHNATVGMEAICYCIMAARKPLVYGIDLESDHIFHHYWRKEKRNCTFHRHHYEKSVLRKFLDLELIHIIK